MRRGRRRGATVALLVVALMGAATLAGRYWLPSAEAASLFEQRTPGTVSYPDTKSVELGVRFSSDVAATVVAIKFYKSPENTGVHTGSLWTADGQRLATVTFADESASGWQRAELNKPVQIQAGSAYVASYLAPSGRYSGDRHAFDARYTRGHLTVPKSGGVFSYGPGGFPSRSWENSNYYVDVDLLLSTKGAPSKVKPPQPSQPANSTTDVLSLPRVPWEGGSAYYEQFPKSKAFMDPNVFPIGVWWADFESDANVKWDKDHGINFYTQLNGTEDGALIGDNGMHWIGSKPLKNMSPEDPAWVGYWLSDETDGKFDPPSVGLQEVQKQIDSQQGQNCPGSKYCRFDYANYTSIVTSDYNKNQIEADEQFVNLYKGPVSVDGYYYTDPHCDVPKSEYRDNAHNPPNYEHCRAAANYGNLIKALRLRDAADGDLKPLWGFVENGAPSENGKYITPEQAQGAAWSMVINEARGLVWFNQSFSGSCQSGNVIRSAEASPNGCNKARVEAMKTVNRQVQSFAPILNTQSYQWTFGPGLDTMLKVRDGHAYVFAMIGKNSDAGSRAFTLPAGISGTSVEVVGEKRTLPIADGKFKDQFSKEHTTHIYRVHL